MKRIACSLIIVFTLSVQLIAQSTWTPASMMHFKRVGGLNLSNDGKRVAYTVGVARMTNDQSDFLTQIWVVTADGNNAQFTFGDKSCSNPRFSPDNQYLAFVSSRGTAEGDVTQLYRVRLAGGEAEQITTGDDRVNSYTWSPDGKHIAFTMQDSVNARIKKEKKEKTDWTVVDDFQNNQLFVVDLTKDANGKYPVRQLTSESYNIIDINWSPDAQTIAFSHQPGTWANDWTSMDISVVPANGGTVKKLVSGPGMDAKPMHSPDGKWIAYITTNGKMHWATEAGVAIVPSQGGQGKILASSHDGNPNDITWNEDSKSIYFDEAYHTTTHLYALPIDGGNPKRLTTHIRGTIGAISVNKKGDIAFLQQDTNTPPEVYLASTANIAGKKLTDIHHDYMVNQPLALSEVLSWKSKDDKYVIEGVVTYPKGYQKGKKYPLILNIHGGPAGVFQETYTGASSPYPIQAFASSGYVVLRANPRGSSGYGTEFRKANHRDWGNNDYEDLMAGVDKLIQNGVVHPDSLVVTGWSYGGYMTSTIITKTNRFKAAMAGAPVTNLMSFNGTADIPDFLPSYFEKEFWDDPAVYAAHSPIFNIKNAQTPTLVIHGMSDDRVPPEQGFQLYRALQRRGVPTEMVTYPRQPHGFREPKFIQDVGERVIAWFDEYLRKKAMARTVSAK